MYACAYLIAKYYFLSTYTSTFCHCINIYTAAHNRAQPVAPKLTRLFNTQYEMTDYF